MKDFVDKKSCQLMTMNIFEFKTICARLAAALGYHEDSIKKAFGKLDETNNFTINCVLIWAKPSMVKT